MACTARSAFIVGLSVLALACSSDDNTTPANDGVGAQADAGSVTSAPIPVIDSGTPATTLDAGGSQPTSSIDSGAVAMGTDGAVGTLDSGEGQGDGGGGPGQSDASSSDASSGGATSLTGTYGSLGAVKPIVSSVWISTGLETILYLSSTPLTCAQVMTEGGRWLLMLPSEGQVLEIVVRGAAKVGTNKIGPAEANYAQGGKSSSTETVASSGTLTFTKVEAKGVIEGTVTATYSSLIGGSGSVMGNFHADFCQGGQEW